MKKQSICKQCGKEFTYETCVSAGMFCDKECWLQNLKEQYKEIKCKQCGKTFSVRPSSKQQFCNYKCAAKWLKGKNHHGYNLEERKRICENCGEEFVVSYKNCPQKFCSNECQGESWRLGDNYSDGYSTAWTEELKTEIRKRDYFVCQLCGLKGYIVHHIDYDKTNCKKDNLVTLCVSCHMKTNFNRKTWHEYFVEMVTKKGASNV